jgi:hypothetical protein
MDIEPSFRLVRRLREGLVAVAPGDVEGLGGVHDVTGPRALLLPGLERLVGVGGLDVEV